MTHDIKYFKTYPPSPWRNSPQWGRASSLSRFTITLRHTILIKTPQAKWSARWRDLYLTTHYTHKRQSSIPSPAFEHAIPVCGQPQTHAFNCAATGIGF